MSRGGETEVRVYEGEVEHFVSAQSEGIGVRVIRDGRTGFAYAGTLDPGAVDEVLAEARDNVAFGTVDEWAGLAEPDGVAAHAAAAVERDARATTPPSARSSSAKELERLTLAADPRVRVDDANYADAWGEAPWPRPPGSARAGRENGCYVSVSTLADDGDETQTGFGFSVGREPDEFDLDRAAARRPPSGRPACSVPPSRRAGGSRSCSTRSSPPSSSASSSSTLERRERRQGPQPVPRPARRAGRRRRRHAGRRPDQPAGVHRHRRRRRGARGPPQRAHRRRRAAAVRPLQLLGPAGRHRVHRQRRSAAGSPARPASAASPCSSCRAPASQAELVAGIDDGLLVQSVSGLHSGVNPVSGDFSTGASGMLITDGELGAPVREFTIASTLQRMLLDVAEVGGDVDWLPMRGRRASASSSAT